MLLTARNLDAAPAGQENPTYLGRRSLQVSALLALLGSLASVPEIVHGHMRGAPEYLLLSSLVVEVTLLILLFVFPRIPLEFLAVTATVYFGIYLSAGCLVSRNDGQQGSYFILFFLWFAPLIVFNWLVNRLALAAVFGKLLLVVPLVIAAASWPQLRHVLAGHTPFLLANVALSHLMLGIMLEPLTRFRASYTLEKARVASMQAEADLVERTAFYDSLTGLPNRSAVKRQLGALLKGLQVGSVGLLVLNLDHFHTLNDALGHAVGDALLKEVAGRLGKARRPGETLAHLGGDEFAIVLEALPLDLLEAGRAADRVCARISEIFTEVFRVSEYECQVSASVGVSLSFASATADELLKRAALALVRAKAQGRNCAFQFVPEMEEQAAARATLARDLRRALRQDEFSLAYQPQVDSAGRLIGAEALLRWQHPSAGMVPPCEFIPLAEEAGLIVPIGRWVLETACRQMAVWSEVPDLEELAVSVNVSVRQLVDRGFVADVQEVLAREGLDGRRLKLEITETAVMERMEESIARIAVLRAQGVRFSLDDFGTGHSSLAYLRRLPLDQLKIDRAFVSGVLGSETDASIARTIILLARTLGIEVIAEGVETEDQRLFLVNEGCFRYQGYYFSRPLTSGQFQEFAQQAAKVWSAEPCPETAALSVA